ncbi:MAG: hypothetical protein M3Z66_18280 [Chloroflexota bacterium]|nr:hypothetical protein [Chloroflexota bacterium]
MTREQVVAKVKHNFRHPADMPDEIWCTEFGALQEWSAPYPSVREEGTPWTKHVWKVTATGERLADYFVPTNRDEKPEPDIVLGMLIEDRTGNFYESGRTWKLQAE